MIDEGRIPQEVLDEAQTACSLLFQIERSSSPQEISDIVARFGALLGQQPLESLRRDILMWLHHTLNAKGFELPRAKINSLMEVSDMLSENLDIWLKKQTRKAVKAAKAEAIKKGHDQGMKAGIKEGMEEGIKEGELAAKRETLGKLLEIKFGVREARRTARCT